MRQRSEVSLGICKQGYGWILDVGAGTIDFKMLLEKGRKLGLKHWFIEHDEPTDALASIKASAAAMLRY